MTETEPKQGPQSTLPRLPAVLLRHMLPTAERKEVLGDLAAEYRARVSSSGEAAARWWVWRQVLSSAPALARRGWWRGWSGFETRSEGLQPGGAMLEGWAQDARYSLRRLRKRPTYMTLVVLTLALGVAGTAAVYGIARELLLDPLPVHAEEEVVAFWAPRAWSEQEFAYVRPEMTGFRSVAAIRPADVTLQLGDAPAQLVRGYSATAELFDVLGVSPALGPGFRRGDDTMGSEPVAVLSHSLWRELGADPGIVGERLELGGEPRTVVGVMAPGFWYPSPQVQVWLAEELDPENTVGNYELVGRMEEGLTVAEMGPHLDRLTRLLGERFEYPEQWDMTRNAELTPVREKLVGSLRPAVLATLAAMAVILLIACMNVAVLMLGQVDSRDTELAVRGALGAGRRRLLQQVVVESLVLGLMAGLVGAGLGVLGFRFLVGALPLGELADAARVDWRLFGTAMAFALLAATAVALAPAISVARSDLQSRLARSRTGGIGGRGGRVENGLVVAQVALVLLLVSGAALLIRSVENRRDIPIGVEVENVAVLDLVIPTTTTAEERARIIMELVEATRTIPGVATAAATQRLPLRGPSDNWGIEVEGRPDLESTSTAFRVVSPDYFEAMGIRVLSGRGLQETDRNREAAEGAVVINHALAEKYFPGVDPLGRRIGFMDRWDRIVGVVENVAENDLSPEPVPARYMVYDQVPWLLPLQTLVLQTRDGQDPAAMLDPARRAVHAAAPSVAFRETTTLANVMDRAVGPALQVMALLSLLGGLALTLGVVGVYGVVSHFVTRRKRDWGIRLALGMPPRSVVGQILGRGGALVTAGAVLGVVAFLALARLLGSLLYGVEAADPVSIGGAAAVLLAAGLLAAFVPALRAARIDPVKVLREE